MAFPNTNSDATYFEHSQNSSLELMDILINLSLGTGNRMLHYLNQHTHITLMKLVREEIKRKVKLVVERSANYPYSRPALEMVLHRIRTFTTERDDIYNQVKFKTVLYQLELVHKLERIDWENHDIIAFSPVDELLIYMNYNSKRYIRILEQWLSARIDKEQEPLVQLQQMQFYRKAFAQLQRKPDAALHEDYVSLQEIFTNWLIHETEYLENQLNLWLQSKEAQENNGSAVVKPEQKIEWALSADQIALILRAADDARVIKAKSKSAVFKLVIPHVRTRYTESLSPSATRTSAYHAEQADKDTSIEALEKMIQFIRDY